MVFLHSIADCTLPMFLFAPPVRARLRNAVNRMEQPSTTFAGFMIYMFVFKSIHQTISVTLRDVLVSLFGHFGVLAIFIVTKMMCLDVREHWIGLSAGQSICNGTPTSMHIGRHIPDVVVGVVVVMKASVNELLFIVVIL